MIKIEHIFPEIYEELQEYKVHMAIGSINKKEPFYAMLKNQFKEWQEYQNNKNFERKYIFSLIYYKPNQWIFGGIYEKINVNKAFNEKKNKEYYKYKTVLTNIQKDLIGKLIIKFNKDFRASYLLLEKHIGNFEIIELLEKPIRIDPFPGYENILIEYGELKEIINEEEASWKSALSSTKGIYLITDKSNGKLYIGSACGENAFWDRWKNYSENGHGNNINLKHIIENEGIDYANNYQFSILEVRSAITDDEIIIKREAHWKNMLKSREFGYNEN